jgi:transcriptional regulator with XRE-family HTH domain
MYEQGRREPSVEMLAALSRCLDVSIDYLVTGREWPAGNRQEPCIILTGCSARFREDGDFRPVSDKELRSILRELLWGE